MVRICVVALIGLPASGKTTFCEAFTKSSDEYHCIHICYDQMFTFKPQDNATPYKESRRKALQAIEQAAIDIKSNISESYIILCDDNNYYAGMRYELYQICRRHSISFGQIYFPIDVAIALERNSIRNPIDRLSDSVIGQMHSRLEAPSSKNGWEKNTFTFQHFSNLNDLHLQLGSWLDNPLNLVYECKDDVNVEPNIIHQIDILLRKRIKELVQLSDGDLKERASNLNSMRKSILKELENDLSSKADLDVDGIVKRLV